MVQRPLCFLSTENESWAEVPRGWSWGLLSLLMIEVVPGKPQSGHCPFTQDLPYRCTCCKCLSPFSFAGLLSDPLLLPDCSFSFSSAVAYANVSCQRLKHKEKSGCAVAGAPRPPFIWPLGAVLSCQLLWQVEPHWMTLTAFLPGQQLICGLFTEKSSVSSVLTHF